MVDSPQQERKFFSGRVYAATQKKAADYFAVTVDELHFQVVQEGGGEKPWLVLAGPKALLSRSLAAAFQLLYEEDGVYLEVYPATGQGQPLQKDQVSNYILRKGISGLSSVVVLKLLEKGPGREKIAEAQAEQILAEAVSVLIAKDEMSAQIRFLPADPGGEALSEPKLRADLAAAGLTFGIDEAALAAAFAEKEYGKLYPIAAGREAQPGKNGALQFHFDIEAKSHTPKQIGDEKVDYRTLELFESVSAGQLLVSRSVATPGVPGYTVKNRELPTKPGKDVKLPKGHHVVINEEQTTLHAEISGMVEYINRRVEVSNVYRINGDCDMSVGNVSFDGTIIIEGNVISGMRLQATGSITVGGVVEGAELIADGSIELKRGIQGMDKGKIRAGGSVTALYIERSTVIAGESIYADSIIHSTVEAGHSILMKGKRSSIVGGEVRAKVEIAAQSIGATAHTQTEITVGMLPERRKRLLHLEAEMKRATEGVEKIRQLQAYLEKAGDTLPTMKRHGIETTISETKQQSIQVFSNYSEEYNELKQEFALAVDGRVHVLETIHPGVTINISTATYRLAQPVQYATFRYQDGEIHYVACEISKN